MGLSRDRSNGYNPVVKGAAGATQGPAVRGTSDINIILPFEGASAGTDRTLATALIL